VTLRRLVSRSLRIAVVCGTFASLVGCGSEEEPTAEAGSAKVPVETGKVNSSIVGTWESENKMSTFVFGKDGKFSVRTAGSVDTRSQSGTIKVNGQSKGIWSEKDGKLMMRYDDGIEGSFDWKAASDGKSLELKAKRSPKPSKYSRRG
jgi:hypothetical protein